MKHWLKQQWQRLWKKRLSETDEAQAHVMGMALASLKAAEANALLVLQVSQQLQDVKLAVNKLQAPSGVLAMFTLAANNAKTQFETYPEGSIEREACLLMASELFGLAKTLQDNIEGKTKKDAKKEGEAA
jgi:hypothetical protein